MAPAQLKDDLLPDETYGFVQREFNRAQYRIRYGYEGVTLTPHRAYRALEQEPGEYRAVIVFTVDDLVRFKSCTHDHPAIRSVATLRGNHVEFLIGLPYEPN